MIGPRRSSARPAKPVAGSSGNPDPAVAKRNRRHHRTSILGLAADEDQGACYEASRSPRRTEACRQARAGIAGPDKAATSTDVGVSIDDQTPQTSKAAGQTDGKRFAWMDSDDEDGVAESAEESAESADVEEPPLPASVAEVRSFSEMLRMAPKLQSGVPLMTASELAAICVAAGRVKFYDAALLDTVVAQLRQRLAGCRGGLAGGLHAEELVSVLASLAGLNAYNQDLFSTIAQVMATTGAATALDGGQLKELLASFKSVKHVGDTVFLESVAQLERQARYEAAKENILRDELQRRWVR